MFWFPQKGDGWFVLCLLLLLHHLHDGRSPRWNSPGDFFFQEVMTWPTGLSWLLNCSNKTLRCCSIYSLKCTWEDVSALHSLSTECSFRHPPKLKSSWDSISCALWWEHTVYCLYMWPQEKMNPYPLNLAVGTHQGVKRWIGGVTIWLKGWEGKTFSQMCCFFVVKYRILSHLQASANPSKENNLRRKKSPFGSTAHNKGQNM